MVHAAADRDRGAMSSSPPDPPAAPSPPALEPPPRRLTRSRSDRVLGGVCGGLAAYFRIDPIIVRLGALLLVLAGGAGILLYLAAVLLVPAEGDAAAADGPTAGRVATVAGVVVLAIALLSIGGGLGWGWGWGGALVPLLLLAAAGVLVYRLAGGGHATGTGRDLARRVGLGLLALAVCGALALGSAWAAATGGETVVAVLVIAAGVALAVAAFAGGARVLIAPALAIALPAAVVSAAGIDARGGVGDRAVRPVGAAQVRSEYHLGVGRLVVDLRRAALPAGDRPLHVRVGVGQAVVVVPRDVCVAAKGRIGMGAALLLGHDEGGLDVQVDDQPPARPRAPRVVVDADIGVGALEVRHTPPSDWHDGTGGWGRVDRADAGGPETNAACAGSTA